MRPGTKAPIKSANFWPLPRSFKYIEISSFFSVYFVVYNLGERLMNFSHLVHTVEPNTKGRDFVVGDIHGAYPLLDQSLQKINFDPLCDRLFSVGDLIDRGTQSTRCREFLRQPWFHAVRGNHESIFLYVFEGGVLNDRRFRRNIPNGVEWIVSTESGVLRNIYNAIVQLPLVIEVPTSRGTIGLVHADVPEGMSWQIFKEKIRAGDSAVIETALWGRDRVFTDRQDGIPGIGRVFAGHTPHKKGPRRYGNLYVIDTGAYKCEFGEPMEAFMTVANMETDTISLLDEPVSGPLNVHSPDSIPTRPFGDYVNIALTSAALRGPGPSSSR
jgi:serine/threonine protein phosphatase 1